MRTMDMRGEEMREEMAVCDPVELVKDLADRIGIHQLYAIARDMRGEEPTPTPTGLKMENEELKNHLQYLEREREHDRGMIEGLKFALRCNGISGGEIHE